MEKIEHTETLAVGKVCQEREKPEITKNMGFLSAFEFLVGYIKDSEASNFSVAKPNVQLGKISKNLVDPKETGNNITEILFNKVQDLTVKNWGLTSAARMAIVLLNLRK